MALQKKKRNFILKYVWKKIQLKKLRMFNYNFFFKKLKNFLLSKKNIKTLSFKNFLSIYDIFFYHKYNINSFFRRLNLYNAYYNEYKIIRFSIHYHNSTSLINFLINFHDNITRDYNSIFNNNLSFYNKTLKLFDNYSISVILWKIKKILKYFFIFIDYFGTNLQTYYLLFYNYFKFFYSKSNILLLNFISFIKISNIFNIKKKIFNFKYLLFNKKMNNNILINYLIKKNLGYYFFKKYRLKKKKLYFKKMKRLLFFFKKKLINWGFYKIFKHFDYLKIKNFYKFFFNINYLDLNINIFQRQFLYLNYFISKLFVSKNFNKKKKSNFLAFVLYRKDFNYFDDTFYSNFYTSKHIRGWYYNIINFFNFNLLSDFDIKVVKSKFLIYQNYYYNNLNWSYHVVFTKSKNKKNLTNLKFFEFKKLNYNFLYFFFKINKLRGIMDYLIFFLLPINLNLIWVESNSLKKSKLKSVVFSCLKFEIKKKDWFLEQELFLNKTKNYIKSFLNKRKKNYIINYKDRLDNLFKNKNFILLKFKNLKILNTKIKLFKNKNTTYLKKKNLKILDFKNSLLGYTKNSNLWVLHNYNIIYNLYLKKKINFILKKINKKKFLSNYKFIIKLNKVKRFTNFWINRLYEYSKMRLKSKNIRYNSYDLRSVTLFDFISNFYPIQQYLHNRIEKKYIYMQNLLLYYNVKKENLFNSVVYIYLKELDYKNINTKLLFNKFFFKLNLKKNLLNNNRYNYIFSIYLWCILYKLYEICGNSLFFLYKYCISLYVLNKLINSCYNLQLCNMHNG